MRQRGFKSMTLALPTFVTGDATIYIPIGIARDMNAMRIRGSMNGGGGRRESFDEFVTVHTHIDPAGMTILRETEKVSPSTDVSASRRCWPGPTLKSILTSEEGTVVLFTPSTEKVIGKPDILI